MKAIEIHNLSKRFGQLKALDEVSVRLEEGKIYGLLGRNGAGKSTLLNILSGRIRPTSGDYTIAGEKPSVDRVLQKIYHVGPDNLFPRVKIGRVFKEVKLFYPHFEMEAALADLASYDLDPDRRFDKLSTGSASIVKTIICLRSGADFMLLDEPTLGHDAVNREMFYENVLTVFAQKGNCILLSSHLITELSPLVQDVIFIDHGRLILEEDKNQLLARFVKLSGPAETLNDWLQQSILAEPVARRDVGAMSEVIIERPKTGFVLPVDPSVSQTAVNLQELFVALSRPDHSVSEIAG